MKSKTPRQITDESARTAGSLQAIKRRVEAKTRFRVEERDGTIAEWWHTETEGGGSYSLQPVDYNAYDATGLVAFASQLRLMAKALDRWAERKLARTNGLGCKEKPQFEARTAILFE